MTAFKGNYHENKVYNFEFPCNCHFESVGLSFCAYTERGICASHDKKAGLHRTRCRKANHASGCLDPMALGTEQAWSHLGYQLRPLEDGKISYSASVTITYTRKSYSIQYLSSTGNLQYGPGEIHENYNNWVKI
jgi:hypothetical protein